MWVVEVKDGARFRWVLRSLGAGRLARDGDRLDISRASIRARAYATEAGRRVRAWAYEELKRNTLVSYIHPENEASKHVARRLGASYERTFELRGSPVEVFPPPRPNASN